MASSLTPRQEIVRDTMIQLLSDFLKGRGWADHENWKQHARSQMPLWRDLGNLLADEVVGKEG